jgi:hypothetical protein
MKISNESKRKKLRETTFRHPEHLRRYPFTITTFQVPEKIISKLIAQNVNINNETVEQATPLDMQSVTEISYIISSIKHIMQIGPIISKYQKRYVNDGSKFVAENFLHFNPKERHKGPNKVFINLDKSDRTIEYFDSPICDDKSKTFENSIGIKTNSPEHTILERKEKNSLFRRVVVPAKHGLLFPVENFYYRFVEPTECLVIQGYFHFLGNNYD